MKRRGEHRLACLAVPLFPLAARLRSDPELLNEALAIVAGDGERAQVVAATRPARRAGLTPGMTLAQARARLPKLIARRRDAACEEAAQEALLDVVESFTPRVEDGGGGLAYLDLHGLERRHDDEEELIRDLLHEVDRRAGLPAWGAVASSKLVARLAGRRSPEPTVVAPGCEGELLHGLALAELSPTAKTLATLERWGVATVGELARLPAAEVTSRLGAAGEELQALARGEDPGPFVPRRPPPVFREGMELEWPLVALEPFLFIARSALERLAERLAGHGLACTRLDLCLELETGGSDERSIALPAPTRDVKTLLRLLHLDLDARPPGAPTLAFVLTAHPDRPRTAQLELFGPAALAPHRLATTLARLFSLLGEDRVGQPVAVDGHRPERFALLPYDPPAPPPTRAAPRPGRGLLAARMLRPPLAVEVLVDVSAGPPRPREVRSLAVEATEEGQEKRPERRPRIAGRVRVASGPWELEEGWWSDEPVEREYWDAELDGGLLVRLYRDKGSDDWHVDGIYD